MQGLGVARGLRFAQEEKEQEGERRMKREGEREEGLKKAEKKKSVRRNEVGEKEK